MPAESCFRLFQGRQHPPTHAVTGVVTVDGQPVKDAIVSFLPANGQYPANGTTDASGRYELTSFTRGDGAMEGSFRVTIVKYEKEGEDKPAVSAEKPAAAEAESEETETRATCRQAWLSRNMTRVQKIFCQSSIRTSRKRR